MPLWLLVVYGQADIHIDARGQPGTIKFSMRQGYRDGLSRNIWGWIDSVRVHVINSLKICRSEYRMPRLSVIVPTYRRPGSLARLLARLSPGNQSLSRDAFEVLIVDDERSVRTRSLVARMLPHAIYLEGPIKGPAANRNRGASAANGEWLVFVDDDCVPDFGWLAAYHAAIHDGCQVYEGKTTCKEGTASPLQFAPVNEHGGCLWSCNMMICATLFHALHGFDESFPYVAYEDVDLRERIRDVGEPIQFVAEAVVDHPPRTLKSLPELINHHKSFLYFKIVKRGKKQSHISLVLSILVYRLRFCGRPGIRDLPRAIGLYAREAAIVGLNFRKWRRHYSRMGSIETA